MITQVRFDEYAPQAMEQLRKGGAFLTVRQGDKLNTMTIGWGTIGYIWRLPIFTVLVRHNRYTYQLLKDNDSFSVSIPLDDSLKNQLAFCGSKSGRDIDKFNACKLSPQPAQVISTPVIAECPLHYECAIVYAQPMELGSLSPEVQQNYYQDQAIHTIFYGKILASYLNR